MHFAFQAYQYPEILDRSELSDEDRMVYRGVIRAIERRRARQRGRTAERQYVYTRPNNPTSQNSQAAYIDIIWLVLMAGVLSGFAFMFLLFTIQGIL